MLDQLDRLRSALDDRYVLDREVGRGGMATVFLAKDVKHNRPVAVKVLHPQLAATIGLDRFLHEIQTAAALNHPHILPLHNSGRADSFLYYVMPFVDGESLRDRLERERQLPVEDSLRIVRDVAAALDYAHAHGFIHRDIKPANIMLDGDEAVVTDFGIARAVSAAGDTRLTETGLALGSPAYMSPEQGAGDEDVDCRSDVYSLGCVVFEMLAGQPPFSGASSLAVRAMHMAERLPSLQIVRPGLPPHIESAVERALAKAPAGRYASAGEFAAALETPSQPITVVSRHGRRPRRWQVAGAATLVALIALLVGRDRITSAAPLDQSTHVIAPFDFSLGPAPIPLTSKLCEVYLSQALALWEDVKTADRFLVKDALYRRGVDTASREDWLLVARDVRAGRLILGEVVPLSDSVLIRASLVDVRDRSSLRIASVTVLPGVSDFLTVFRELAARLLGPSSLAEETAALRTTSFAAVTDYAQGLSLLEEGNFRGAIKRFASALDKDPDFADAHFWIAQSRAWSGDSSSTFRHSARRAAQLDSDIGPNLRELVAPLVNLAEDQFPQACEEYERLLAADSANYVAWLGLGECHRRDRTVVTDPASPSGWRFRGSYYSAANAYRGALRLVPLLTPGVIRGLKRVLISDPSGLRGGVAAVPDTGSFLAWPERDDTLAFVPRPSAETSSSGPPPTHRVAIEANRGELLRVVRNWAEAYPRLFTAQAALAEALEKAGELDGPTVNVSALNVARRARSLARSVADSVAAAIIEVRILTKLGRFTESQELARSTLDDFANRTPALAGSLAPLAALTGRPVLTARLMGSAAAVAPAHPLDRLADVSTPVLVARETLLGYATVGVPVDSIAQWIGRVDSLVRIHVEPRVADAVLCAASDRALSLAFPVLRRVVEDEPCRQRSYLLQLQYLLARGDTTRLLELVDRLDLIRMDALPGEMAIEGTYQEAWVLAAVGDTARAIQRLDRSLSALRTLGMWLMSEPSQAAGLVRAMALRAELAAASGDRATARRWATPVIDLWGRGGPDVQPLVGRMGALRE